MARKELFSRTKDITTSALLFTVSSVSFMFHGKWGKKSNKLATIFGNERAYIAFVSETASTFANLRYKDMVDQSELHGGNSARRYSRRSFVVQRG